MNSEHDTISILNVPTDIGSNRTGASLGPYALKAAGLGQKLDRLGFDVKEIDNISGPVDTSDFKTGQEKLKDATIWYQSVKRQCLPLTAITIGSISMSSDRTHRDGFGPFSPGFRIVDYASTAAIENAINENTAAIMIEPIQGEAGIIIPEPGYLKAVQDICMQHMLLFVLDEIQTGLGRTGKLFCYQHETGVKPDMLILGKALSGGVYPVSAVLSTREVLGLFKPGQHGSTFGGNPLAAAVASAALDVIVEENLAERSRESGQYLINRLNHELNPGQYVEIRGKGLFIGIELKKSGQELL